MYVCIFWVIYYYCKGAIGGWEWYLPYSIKAKKQEYLLGKIKFRSEKGKRIIFFFLEEKDSKARICLYVAKHMLN